MDTDFIARRAEAEYFPYTHVPTTRIALRVTGVLGFALLTAVAAQVKFAIPGTPVPATLQTLVVLLAGVTLGSALGTASMILYLLLGAVGHYAFAVTGYGWEALTGPTAGYLVGFVLAQPLIGRLTRRSTDWRHALAAVLAGNAAIFATGLLWLGLSLRLDVATTLALGCWPFVVGEILKIAAALPIGCAALRVIRRRI